MESECEICKMLRRRVQKAEAEYNAANKALDGFVRDIIDGSLKQQSPDECRSLQTQIHRAEESLGSARYESSDHAARCVDLQKAHR